MKKLYPVSVACKVLEVSASGYFNWQRQPEDGHESSSPGRRHSDEALLAHTLRRSTVRALWAGAYQAHECPGRPRLPADVAASVWRQPDL